MKISYRRALPFSLLLALLWSATTTAPPIRHGPCPDDYKAVGAEDHHLRESVVRAVREWGAREKDNLKLETKLDNDEFRVSYHAGSKEERDTELGYADFKSLRLEVAFGDKTYVVHVECPLVKRLNDEMFKNKAATDVLVAMINRAVEKHFGAALREKLRERPQDVEKLFAQAAEAAVKDIEGQAAAIPGLKEYLKDFGFEPAQLLGMGWADRAAGGGYGDVAAALAARFTRKRNRGDKAYRSFDDPQTKEIIFQNLKNLRAMNAAIYEHAPGAFREFLGTPCLDEGVYELVRKFPVPDDLIRNDPSGAWDLRAKGSADFQKLVKAIQIRYGSKITEREVRFLAEYVSLVDTLSSPIFVGERKGLPWRAEGGALTGDLVGGGAENLALLEYEMLHAADRLSSKLALEGSRRAEREVTEKMEAKKLHFDREVREWVKRELGEAGKHLEAGHSGDDMLAMIPRQLLDDPAALHRLFTRLNALHSGRIRVTLGPETFVGTNKHVDIELKQKISIGLEGIHKKAFLLAEENGVPYKVMRAALVVPKATISESGEVRFQLLMNGVPPEYQPKVQLAFAEAAKKEGPNGGAKTWSIDQSVPILHP